MNDDPAAVTVSAAMIREHLAYLTVGYFDDRDVPPPVLDGYARCARQVRASAERRGDLPLFKLGLQHILLDPAIDARDFNPDGFSYGDRDLRDIIGYLLRTTIAPDEGPPDPHGPASRVVLQHDADEKGADDGDTTASG